MREAWLPRGSRGSGRNNGPRLPRKNMQDGLEPFQRVGLILPKCGKSSRRRARSRRGLNDGRENDVWCRRCQEAYRAQHPRGVESPATEKHLGAKRAAGEQAGRTDSGASTTMLGPKRRKSLKQTSVARSVQRSSRGAKPTEAGVRCRTGVVARFALPNEGTACSTIDRNAAGTISLTSVASKGNSSMSPFFSIGSAFPVTKGVLGRGPENKLALYECIVFAHAVSSNALWAD